MNPKKRQTKQEPIQQFIELLEEEVLGRCIRLYQAEELIHHKFGWESEDEDASNGKAWFADLSFNKHHIIYGPYELLPKPANYIAFFKMKTDDNSSSDVILTLEIAGGGFTGATIHGFDFHEPNKYQLFGLKFNCKGTTENHHKMEYRVRNEQRSGKVWIDYIAIIEEPASSLTNSIGTVITQQNEESNLNH